MQHRHLNHERFTLAAIDDVISRGRWREWAELRRAVLSDHALLDKVERVCRPYVSDPYAQRHHFWMHYVEEHRADAHFGDMEDLRLAERRLMDFRAGRSQAVDLAEVELHLNAAERPRGDF